MHLVNHSLPFGGVGASGMGAYHGERRSRPSATENRCSSSDLARPLVLLPALQRGEEEMGQADYLAIAGAKVSVRCSILATRMEKTRGSDIIAV